MPLVRGLLRIHWLLGALALGLWLISTTPAAAQRPMNFECFVWDDWNANGSQLSTKPGLAGITVQLWNAAKTDLLTTTLTTPSGLARLGAPGSGSYRLRVVLPLATDTISPMNLADGDDSRDSDFHPSGINRGFTDIIFLASDDTVIRTIDCGLVLQMLPDHTIGNRVFRAQANGTQPIDGFDFVAATVELLDASGTVLQTTTTRRLGFNHGYYGFNAPAGNYRLRFIPAESDFVPTPFQNAGGDDTLDSDINERGQTALITLAAGQIRHDVDAGFVRTFRLGNLVWDDYDADGKKDPIEPGLPGMTVQLWNATKSLLWDTAVTDAEGVYELTGPGPGTYRLRIVLPGADDAISPKDMADGDDQDDSDFNPSGPHRGYTDIIEIQPSLVLLNIIDCGLLLKMVPGHTIGNRVFRAQAGGTMPADETNSAAATVELLDASGTVLQSTTTRRLGPNSAYYGFTAPPGSYRLRFTPLDPELIPTPFQDSGSDDSVDSDIDGTGLTPLFTLAAGQIRQDLDAGFVRPFRLGNLVWSDENGDGLQDMGEPGVPDVIVELWSADKTRRWDAAVTDENGHFSLTGAGPGDYRLWVLRPLPQDAFSPRHAGDYVDGDSEILATTADFGFSDVLTTQQGLVVLNTYDAGLKLAPGRRLLTPLRITAFNRSTPSLTFTGPAGGTYQLERTESPLNWNVVGNPIVTTTSPTTITLLPADLPQGRGFLRVRRTR